MNDASRSQPCADAKSARLEAEPSADLRLPDEHEAFLAGWQACDDKWEGPSAAGYPTNDDAAWDLFSTGRFDRLCASVDLYAAAKEVDHFALVILSAVNFDQRDSLDGVSSALRKLRAALAMAEGQP